MGPVLEHNNNAVAGCRIRGWVGGAVLAAAMVSTTVCAQDVVPAPKFDIQRFAVTGNTLLPNEEVERIVAQFTGKDKDFADIQRALEALEIAYRERGYGIVQVLLPEQDITKGVVQFRVLQAKVGKVVIDGNTRFDNTNIRRSLPTVTEGVTPNSRDIARNLQMLAEHPVKQTTVLLRSGAAEDQVDVNVKVADDKPWRFVFTLDDTGTADTGYLRSGIGFQHSNLFNRDHTLSAQYITSPTQQNKVSIYGLGYRIPFYNLNSTLDLIAGYSDVNSGTVQGLFNVAGSGTVFGARWTYFLPKMNDIEHKVALGLDYRAFQNRVTIAGVGLVPDITIHPVSLTYSGLYRMTASELNFYAAVSTNIPGGNDGRQSDFTASRANATDSYKILRYGTSYIHAFRNEWQGRAALNGQYTKDSLIAGEQFGLGGPDSLRGYLLREVTNDKGFGVQLEAYTPNFAPKIGLPEQFRSRLVGFYEYGRASRNNGLVGETESRVISDFGVGLRVSYGKTANLRFDVAHVQKDAGTRQRGDNRISAALAVIF